ncbi:uncharacterized protein [Spinacia oleracea]|uniref:PWI domain-containing protein n=1 Tax=Spinacia oleracea TaxID=3562 RepID=A0ABM3RAC1_SPIOL|nr:uncharacterized protein LOC110791233 [Spinacia oleracea]
MEKNTGKFMKELWSLLLSAQKNASGVPQQFLDAKEEETKKKKAENDRIFDEIQRRKEKEAKESEEEKERQMVASAIIWVHILTSNYCRMTDLANILPRNQIEGERDVLVCNLEMRMELV